MSNLEQEKLLPLFLAYYEGLAEACFGLKDVIRDVRTPPLEQMFTFNIDVSDVKRIQRFWSVAEEELRTGLLQILDPMNRSVTQRKFCIENLVEIAGWEGELKTFSTLSARLDSKDNSRKAGHCDVVDQVLDRIEYAHGKMGTTDQKGKIEKLYNEVEPALVTNFFRMVRQSFLAFLRYGNQQTVIREFRLWAHVVSNGHFMQYKEGRYSDYIMQCERHKISYTAILQPHALPRLN